jgi:hypothetical protein
VRRFSSRRAYGEKLWTGQGKTGTDWRMGKKADERAERLAAALRENLRKRKAQDLSPPQEKRDSSGTETVR